MHDAFARSLDEAAHAAFAAAGMGAGTGAYTPPPPRNAGDDYVPPEAVQVRVLVNRGQALLGDWNQMRGQAVTIGYMLADVTPAVDGSLVLGGETFVNVQEVDNDGGYSYWAVRNG